MTFEELYLELFHPLLRQALYQRVPYHDAEDVVHDVFMSYLQFEETVAEPEKYLKVAVRYRCASYWRREVRQWGAALPERSSAPEYDRRIAVASIWPRLSRRDRRVLGLRFQGELKIRQIATRLGVSPKRAEKILRNAIDRAAALVDETERRGVGVASPQTDTYVSVALLPASGEKVAGGRMRGGASRRGTPPHPPLRGTLSPRSGARGNMSPRRIIRAHVCRLRGAALPRTSPHPAVLSARRRSPGQVPGQLSGADGLLQASGGGA